MKKLSLIYLAILLVACAGVSGQATLPTLAPEANQADCDDVFIHVDGYEHDESVIEMIDGKPIDGMLCYIKDRRLISKQTYKDGWEEGPAEWYYEHNACDPDDLEFCKVEAIAYFKQGLLNGRINKYYESGKLATEGTFLDGKRQGPQTDYYENGNLKSEIFLKDDQQHGLATFYYESGGVSSTQYWVAGEGDGLTTNYDETGKLKSEIFYKNGEKNGLAKEYDENEKLKTEIIYANGKKNEFAKEYYGNGQLKSEVVYKDDKLVGSAKYYYEDGALKYDAPVQYKPSLDVL
ncbi:MAG: toxin-antitoxin system YwqK family antitoxin, partial [Deferribacteraceae bacterium]|nr:toxin-antitoxin system YwqK family antitoxin [Deferribacteraceae bacterium]